MKTTENGIPLKKAGKSPCGGQLYKCPVCGEKYGYQGLAMHIPQMAGKEAQYLMADMVYSTEENLKDSELDDWRDLTLPEYMVYEVLEECPHWEYLIDHPKIQKNPVARKE